MWVCPSFSLVVYLFYCLFVVDFNSFKSPLFSTDQDEEMDTSPLAKPFFTIDREGDADGGEGKQEEEAGDSGEEEEPDRQGEEQEDEEDDDVSVTQKTSSNGGRVESGAANGNHGAESEESSDEEEEEQQEEANKRLCVAPAAARCQTVAS